MEAKAQKLIPSGIEPVDELLGGLERGKLYLVHGDASGKSLFGIKFLIEGLKRGENGALVIRYSPEDAVRRVARLGYDCLEDIYSGRLIILEYTNEIVQQIARLRDITPVLRELEWLLGDARPQRVIFDPVSSIVMSEREEVDSRVRAFAEWSGSFGATTVLIANGEEKNVVENFKEFVRESFRFEVKEDEERATRLFVFEKSPDILDQAIEVDPSRGVFLLGRAQEHFATQFKITAPPGSAKTSEAGAEDLPPSPPASMQIIETEAIIEAPPETPAADESIEDASAFKAASFDLQETSETVSEILSSGASATDSLEEAEDDLIFGEETAHLDQPPAQGRTEIKETNSGALLNEDKFETILESGRADEWQSDVLSDLLDDLAGAPSPIDLDSIEPQPVIGKTPGEEGKPPPSPSATQTDSYVSKDRRDTAADDSVPATQKPDEPGSAPLSRARTPITSRAVEILLRPPEFDEEADSSDFSAIIPQRQEDRFEGKAVNPKDFSILVIDDNPLSCEITAQELGEYTVEVVHDGVSGLAKLISFKPDLIILNVDLPIVDGFKVLAHIRASLNMPIIIVSGTHMRASDRVLATELGADHYMTKPFNVKELRQKTRQLIARYRGISSWIITSPSSEDAPVRRGGRKTDRTPGSREPLSGPNIERFTPYQSFIALVETSVKSALDTGTSFSIVGCRLSGMTSNGGQKALRLFELVRPLVRETDLISTNSRNDLVVFLADADGAGAQAFTGRLRERVMAEIKEEPSIWLRSFPETEESIEPAGQPPPNGNLHRRAGDIKDQNDNAAPTQSAAGSETDTGEFEDPNGEQDDSPIDFLDKI